MEAGSQDARGSRRGGDLEGLRGVAGDGEEGLALEDDGPGGTVHVAQPAARTQADHAAVTQADHRGLAGRRDELLGGKRAGFGGASRAVRCVDAQGDDDRGRRGGPASEQAEAGTRGPATRPPIARAPDGGRPPGFRLADHELGGGRSAGLHLQIRRAPGFDEHAEFVQLLLGVRSLAEPRLDRPVLVAGRPAAQISKQQFVHLSRSLRGSHLEPVPIPDKRTTRWLLLFEAACVTHRPPPPPGEPS